MEISIGSYKFRLEILILIFIVFWVMFGHVLCSCCLFKFEGFVGANNSSNGPQFGDAKIPEAYYESIYLVYAYFKL